MNMLLPNMESQVKIGALIELTNMTSQPTIAALYDHLCRDRTETGAAAKNMIEQSNLARAIAKLNEKAAIVERIKNDDWAKFKKSQLEISELKELILDEIGDFFAGLDQPFSPDTREKEYQELHKKIKYIFEKN